MCRYDTEDAIFSTIPAKVGKELLISLPYRATDRQNFSSLPPPQGTKVMFTQIVLLIEIDSKPLLRKRMKTFGLRSTSLQKSHFVA